ncbi:MAG: glycoside hydrolase family 15 protein [Candidatus Dormibacteraeota bacterium]|nr:glycoside hydrolase family 15 protein [Candidatus Dormibacteraeota bacterium]
MPRLDYGAVFARMLDWGSGGFCSVAPADPVESRSRAYLDNTMVLQTTFVTRGTEATVTDALLMRPGGRMDPLQELVRVIEGVRGDSTFQIEVVPRFDYGAVKPWIRRAGRRTWAVLGGDDGLLISCDVPLELRDQHDLVARVKVRGEQRVRLSIRYVRPHLIDEGELDGEIAKRIDDGLKTTSRLWHTWSRGCDFNSPDRAAVLRSALVLKALQYAPTGAIAAAATTSLPEEMGGARNWDYRFSWIRDSFLSIRSLASIGLTRESDGFRRFIQRTSAGSAHQLQIMYGLGGERRLTEFELPFLEGYRSSKPVRIGNGAAEQEQLDAYGDLLLLAWEWHQRGHSPDDDYWRFLCDLVEVTCDRWKDPDRGIWEMRGEPRHFVHSKVLCWAAIDRGIALAEESMRQAPLARWKRTVKQVRDSILENGVDRRRGCFVQSYGSTALDSSLLLIPGAGFVDYADQLMVGTVNAIRKDLEEDGLLLRYRTATADDGLGTGREGFFLACTFWLAECLAGQGRMEEARAVFDRVVGTSNDLGLFAEEFEPRTGELLGNFPQGLTHLAHIAAAVRLAGL